MNGAVLSDGAASYTQANGSLIAENRGGTTSYYNPDALGSTRSLTNSSQTKTDTFQFDAFGLSTGRTGTTATPFGFVGGKGYQADSSGLMLLGHRLYDASTGRFLSRDPIHDGYNWYDYCQNNPVNAIDPTGNSLFTPWEEGCGGYEIGGGGGGDLGGTDGPTIPATGDPGPVGEGPILEPIGGQPPPYAEPVIDYTTPGYSGPPRIPPAPPYWKVPLMTIAIGSTTTLIIKYSDPIGTAIKKLVEYWKREGTASEYVY